jgi:uncharacterized membrane protein YhaH (DUF805 family)
MDWQNLFLTNVGRLDRQPWWIGSIVIAVISIIARLIIHIVFGHGSSIGHLLDGVIGLLLLYPAINIGIKRFHDRDKSGWWVLIAFVPIIGWIWYIVECGFLPGTDGPNKYDPNPA